MNILMSSLSGNDKTEGIHYLRVFQRLGHQVFRFTLPAYKEDPSYGLHPEAGFAPETTLDSLIRLSGMKPDIFLFIEPLGLIPRGIECASFPTVCILSDTHRDLPPRLKLARFFDHIFLYHRNSLPYFKEHRDGHVHWYPCACDLEVFRPLEGERNLDVSFVGNLMIDKRRARLLSRLSERYIVNEQRFYLQREIPKVYSQSKIVLNLPVADDLNFRTFEAMSCGAMLLTRRVSNGQELLFEEGRHFAAFDDERELFDKIHYYLSNPEEREIIAAAGLAEIRQRHRLEQRIEELIGIVTKKPDKVAPIRRMSPSQIDRQYAWLYEYWRMVDPGLSLARQARWAGRPWLPLLLPIIRSILRLLFR